MSLELELKSVDKKANLKLFVFLGLSFLLTYIFDKFIASGNASGYFSIILIGSILAYVIHEIITKKKAIAIKYNLQCTKCNKIPKALFIKIAAKSNKCPYCGHVFN